MKQKGCIISPPLLLKLENEGEGEKKEETYFMHVNICVCKYVSIENMAKTRAFSTLS